MINNKVNDIQIQKSGFKRSPFNFSHDVNTTLGFGECQPFMCKLLTPNSKTTVSAESLIRPAPMVAPTFGRIRMRDLHNFVSFSDLSPLLAHLLAQTSVSAGTQTFVPTQVPHCKLSMLSCACLVGSSVSIWRSEHSTTGDHVWTLAKQGSSSFNNITSAIFDDFCSGANYKPILKRRSSNVISGTVSNGWCLNFDWIVGGSSGKTDDVAPYIPVRGDLSGSTSATDLESFRVSFFDSEFSPDSADIVNVFNRGSYDYALCFKLSGFGKRLRKVLIGCGYQIDTNSDEYVSMLPLFAFYKSYFDVFGLTLYSNYFTSNCAKILTYYDIHNLPNVSPAFYNTGEARCSIVWGFIVDLANCYATYDQDFVSAHIPNTTISPSSGISGRLIDITDEDLVSPEIVENDSSSDTVYSTPNHAFINTILHGHLDEETLKRLYKWTNCNTVAGKKIADILRSQGLGDFVDNTKPSFIGSFDTPITVSDVVSTADTVTDDNSKGAFLGQYGGRGIGYNDGKKTFTYETSEFGFWVSIGCIIPEGGYCQAIDPNVFCLSKLDFYNPEFDALGYEASRRSIVCGSIPYADDINGRSVSGATFGYIPRYSSFKVAFNKMNGDFSLRSTKETYLPYSIDRVIDLCEPWSEGVSVASDGNYMCVSTVELPPSKLPNASLAWRYVARYPWLQNYNRIFAYSNSSEVEAMKVANNLGWDFTLYSKEYDNFMLHEAVNMRCYASMLPIEESFETSEDGNFNGSVTKS